MPARIKTVDITSAQIPTVSPYTTDGTHTPRIYVNRPQTFAAAGIVDIWFAPTYKCIYKCPQCHCQSSPTNNKVAMMTLSTVRKRLVEIREAQLHFGIKKVKFCVTGGEPFMHPQMPQILELFHSYDLPSEILVLTTGHSFGKCGKKVAPHLTKNVEIRISIDHYTEAGHVEHRHNAALKNQPDIWQAVLDGMAYLQDKDCKIGVTGQVPAHETRAQVVQGYRDLFAAHQWRVDGQVNIFDSVITNYDEHGDADLLPNGITRDCLTQFDKTLQDIPALMCASSMLITEDYIAPCTIIPYNTSYQHKGTVSDVISSRLTLAHKNCSWCLNGNSCDPHN